MLNENQHPHNKSIMITLLGRPNAGKSTLINHLLGYDLSIVSPKPQTTRNHFQCAFTIDRTEIILIDTPGIHFSNQELNNRMNHQARMAASEVDLHFLLLDCSKDITTEFMDFKKTFETEFSKTWVIFTKSDLLPNAEQVLASKFIELKTLEPKLEKFFIVSAKDGTNIHLLTGAICDIAQSGPHLYPDGSASNMNERFFVTEYIREQAFRLLNEELPYEIAVIIDEYKDLRGKEKDSNYVSHISASILVNRPSQRAIVVGRGGSIIKEIGTHARKKIEAMLDGKVHLNLHVKVSPRWFANNYVLDEIGLPRSQTQARVWRKKS